MDKPVPVMGRHTRPPDDSQGTRFLWTDVAANSTGERFLPRTATGGQAHARPSGRRQMSPDESERAAVAGAQTPREPFLQPVVPPPGTVQSRDPALTQRPFFSSGFDWVSPPG